MAIWLAFEETDGSGTEHHMRWEGHETLETAREELKFIIHAVLMGGGKPPNTYIYEADEPLYGHSEEAFDLGDFENVFEDLDKINESGKQLSKIK